MKPYEQTFEAVLQEQKSSPQGLTEAETEARRASTDRTA